MLPAGLTKRTAAVLLAAGFAFTLSGCDGIVRIICVLSGASSCEVPVIPPTEALLPPTDLEAQAGDGSVTLHWRKSESERVKGHEVRRSLTAGGPYEPIPASPSTVLGSETFMTATDTGLENGTTYHYVVLARDGDETVSSDQVSATPRTGADGGLKFLADWGREGSAEGEFRDPRGIATDAEGHVYVADSGNNRVQKFTHAGAFVASWGSEGTGREQFRDPRGIATDSDGSVYVADTGNDRIQKFDPGGEWVDEWGRSGDGIGQLRSPAWIAVDAAGDVYVTDANDRVQKFSSFGEYITGWGGSGTGSGQFQDARGVSAGYTSFGIEVSVVDGGNNRIQQFSTSGEYRREYSPFNNSEGAFPLSDPHGIVNWTNAGIAVADTGNRRIVLGGFGTARALGSPGNGDGQFGAPYGVASDCRANLYVTDTQSDRVQKFGSREQPPPPCTEGQSQAVAARLALRSGRGQFEAGLSTSSLAQGRLSRRGGTMRGRGVRAAGRFSGGLLPGARAGSAMRVLRYFSAGRWRSRFDFSFDPTSGRGTARGYSLATAQRRKGGRLCLSFRGTVRVSGGEVSVRGTFRTRGGTGAASRLTARGRFAQRQVGDALSGSGTARQGPATRLAPACRKLARTRGGP